MVEILCTVTGIIAGIAVVASIMHQQGERGRFQANDVKAGEDAERIEGLANQLQMLTHRVAADVSAHSEKVVHINERLLPTSEEPAQILSAISELIEANEAMQGQLAAAQQRLSQQSRQIEVTARQARTDALTGLANRRALDEFLESCIEAIQPGELASILLLDIDHFKSFNDSYGHITGDAVLASFARSIAVCCDGKSYAARYGGEEFAVILTGSSMEKIVQDAAQLRAFVSEQVIAYEDLRLTITSSGGLTEIKSGDTIQQAYERADEGLYRAKKNGRNCGYWLSSGEWFRFTSHQDEPQVDTTERAILSAKQKNAVELRAQLAKAVSQQVPEALPAGAPASASIGSEVAKIHETQPDKSTVEKVAIESQSDILDLTAFLERLDLHLKQLSRANLPATTVLIGAIGLETLSPSLAELCWSNALSIIQLHVRGIDVLCRFRQRTLCIFMPGSSLNAALERAGRMQHELASARLDMTADSPFPVRFSVSLATAIPNEGRGAFMQRLEMAFEEAQDAKPCEVVIHDGNSCHTQTI